MTVLLLVGGESQATTLEERTDRILLQSGITRGRFSIEIVSLRDGRVLLEKTPDLALNPASNVKIVTAATALRELGPDFTFKTEFYSDSLIRNGKIRNLWLKGYGDPFFVTEELESVCNQFWEAGLREIEGRVFVDDTYFDRYNLTTYLSDVGEKIYGIMTGPLSYNFNRTPFEADLPKESQIPDPAISTGTAAIEALKKRGVVIGGGPAGDVVPRREAVPPKALLILAHSSPPLREILKGLGKFSNNFIAEELVKALAAVHFGPPGSTRRGLSLLKSYLTSLGIPPNQFVLDNGSGLSRLTRLSSDQLVRVLVDLYASPQREDFISSLSVAGVDGTMKTKMRRSPLKGKLFAKTGTLNGVSALSGYLLDRNQEIAFSFLWNDVNASQASIRRAEERILEEVLK